MTCRRIGFLRCVGAFLQQLDPAFVHLTALVVRLGRGGLEVLGAGDAVMLAQAGLGLVDGLCFKRRDGVVGFEVGVKNLVEVTDNGLA